MLIKLDPVFQQNFIFKNKQDLFNQLMALDGERFRELENRRTLKFIKNNKAYFIKQHFGIGYKEILKNLSCARPPILGAEAEYLAINKLTKAGVATQKIIGYGKRYINPAHQESFLITEELKNIKTLEDLCKFWAIEKPEIKFRINLIYAIAELAKKMHQQGINHRDFYLCHILLDLKNNNKINLYLMDLHRAQTRESVPLRWRIKDIAGLYFSSIDAGVNQKDIFRFLKKYFNLSSLREILFKYKDFLYVTEKRAKNLYGEFWTKQMQKVAKGEGDFLPYLFREQDRCVEAAFMPPAVETASKPVSPEDSAEMPDKSVLPSSAVETLLCNASTLPFLNREGKSTPLFFLTIEENNKKNNLSCEKILRAMPNKRVIFYGKYNNKSAVIKFLFQEKKYQQELAGYQAIQALPIHTPILFNKFVLNKKLFILVYEYIQPELEEDDTSKNNSRAALGCCAEGGAQQYLFCEHDGMLCKAGQQDAQPMLCKSEALGAIINKKISMIQQILAILHDHHLHYKDLHFDNFITAKNKIFLIDAANIQAAKESDINNLAALYALLPLLQQDLIPKYFQQYAALRNIIITKAIEEKLYQAVHKIILKRLAQFEKRSIRNCRDISVIKDKSNFMAYQKDFIVSENIGTVSASVPALEVDLCICSKKQGGQVEAPRHTQNKLGGDDLYAFFENPDAFITQGECIKRGNTCMITKTMLNKQPVIIKCYQHKINRAILAWKRAYALNLLGIPTPKPIAIYSDHKKAYFMMEYIQGKLLSDIMTAESKEGEQNFRLTSLALNLLRAEVYRILFALHYLGEVQRDTKATNFIVSEEKGDKRVFLLDLDGIRTPYRWALTYCFKKSIQRFCRNWDVTA